MLKIFLAVLLIGTYFVQGSCPTPITWDFQCGCMTGWSLTGKAFVFQPTLGDNPTARNRGQPSKHQGRYWIGGYQNYTHYSFGKAGSVIGDKLTGTMTSQKFEIFTNRISFLIGGGCGKRVGLQLIVNGVVVRQTRGKCNETMQRRYWDVSSYIGKSAKIKAIDFETGGWGHLNFDDIKFVK